jgi:single-strand DNA-binding protein
LCNDLELRYTKNGKSVLENTLGVKKGLKDKDTGYYESDFIDFVCFEKKADYLNTYAKKGDKVAITGKLRVDNWKDEEGKNHSKTYVVADSLEILTSRPKTKLDLSEELPF